MRNMDKIMAFCFRIRYEVFCVCVLLSIYSLPRADDQPAPTAPIHLGVATCAGSNCHGANKPLKDSPVLQDEFITWYRKDEHSKAYKTLLEDESKRIAQNLGLEAAHKADICLDCHADNVPASQRGKRFQISDGVGCEVCHNGAEQWLGPHVTGIATHSEMITAGLYPLENPQARAKLCLSCHLGNKNREITHKIMAAGHPRLSFELDTFTIIEPAHFVIDADYRKRKEVWNGVEIWAIGQMQGAMQLLESLSNPKHFGQGLMPELVFFDCHSCHHPMSQLRWAPRKTTGLDAGVLRLNDSNLLMLIYIAKVIDPALSDQFGSDILLLHKGMNQSHEATLNAIKGLKASINTLRKKITRNRFSRNDLMSLIKFILGDIIAGELRDYAAAEQAAMALDSSFSTLAQQGALESTNMKNIQTNMDHIYLTLKDEDKYKPSAFIDAAKSLAQSLK